MLQYIVFETLLQAESIGNTVNYLQRNIESCIM